MLSCRLGILMIILAARIACAQANQDAIQELDQFLAQQGTLPQTLARRYGPRIVQLRQKLADKPRDIPRGLAWLDDQLRPFFDGAISISTDSDKGCSLVVSCLNDDAQPRDIAQFTLDFVVFEELAGKPLDRRGITITPLTDNDEPGPAGLCTETYLSPDRVRLAWPLPETARRFRIAISPAGTTQDAPLQRLIGMGDQLMLATRDITQLPGNIWSAKFTDMFGDHKPALVAGRWTDFAHIYQNTGFPGPFQSDESLHFLARDTCDEPIGTDEHHGLAFSIVDPVDADGDGKQDLFLCRYYNTTPLFAKNIRQKPGQLDFADPYPVPDFPRGWRYAYGDLDGDGLADAVAIQLQKTLPVITFRKGLGPDIKGVIRFGPAQTIPLVLPESLEADRGSSVCTPSLSLDDLNGDGLLDLSILVPVFLHVAFNEGSRQNFAFNQAQVVMTDAGKPIECRRYYPFFAWHDINQDGRPDLFLRSVRGVYLAKDSVLSVAAKETPLRCLSRQAPLNYAGLANFEITTINNDGQDVFCQIATAMDLSRFSLLDGLCQRQEPIPLEPPGTQRFGCPDSTEYGALYAQIRCFDFDGDGRMDVLTNTEHNWRLGYFSLYRGLDTGAFAPEEQLAPKPSKEHLEIVKTKRGKALAITPRTTLDYLSWESSAMLSPAGGAIRFTFTPSDGAIPPLGRVFFSSAFWDPSQIDANALHNLYYQTDSLADLLKSIPGFVLAQLPDGRLLCQLGREFMSSPLPIVLQRDVFYRIALSWDRQGTTLTFNDQILCRSQHRPAPFANRLHLGSYAWMAIQHVREYPDRRKTHPTDFSCPANGLFTEFTCEDPMGQQSFALNLKNDLRELPPRSTIAYRCVPAVTSYQNQPALIAHFDDNRRTETPGAKARLHLVPFARKPGQPPHFATPIPLRLHDGTPFYAHTRTEIVATDWNQDGAPDIILATENVRNPYNVGVELFLNDGQWHFIRTADSEISRLNELMTAHHDIKLSFAALTNADEPDIVTWTDPGIRAFSRAFLRQNPTILRVDSIAK